MPRARDRRRGYFFEKPRPISHFFAKSLFTLLSSKPESEQRSILAQYTIVSKKCLAVKAQNRGSFRLFAPEPRKNPKFNTKSRPGRRSSPPGARKIANDFLQIQIQSCNSSCKIGIPPRRATRSRPSCPRCSSHRATWRRPRPVGCSRGTRSCPGCARRWRWDTCCPCA